MTVLLPGFNRGVIHVQSAREIMFNYNVYSSVNLVIWTHKMIIIMFKAVDRE